MVVMAMSNVEHKVLNKYNTVQFVQSSVECKRISDSVARYQLSIPKIK